MANDDAGSVGPGMTVRIVCGLQTSTSNRTLSPSAAISSTMRPRDGIGVQSARQLACTSEIEHAYILLSTQRRCGRSSGCASRCSSRVNATCEAWQRDILSRFGVKLGNTMKEMHMSILKARNNLTHQSIEGLAQDG